MYLYRQLKKQKEEERLALEAKRKAEEEAAKAERERKLKEERQKREQERLRKEEERRQREEERIRKEEDKRRRLKEERERAAEKEKKRKEKEEKEQREREERERIEREKKAALAAKQKAEEDERRAKEQQEELVRQEKAKTDLEKSSSPSPATTTPTTTPMRPVIDEAARQKTLMDALVGAPASSSSSSPQPLLNRTSLLSAGIANIPQSMPGDIKPLGMDLPQPPHPLFPPHAFATRDIPPPIGPVRQGEPATSPTRGYAPLGDRGMLPIGHGRLSSSFDAGRTVARPGAQIAPIGQPVNGRRPSTTAGPVGSPMGSRTHWLNSADDNSNKRSPLATSDAENSFFSNFLFGDHGRGTFALFMFVVNTNMHCLDMSLMHPELATSRLQERRFSLESAGVGWTNGKISQHIIYCI